MEGWVLEIDRRDIRRAELAARPVPSAGPGEIAFAVDLVALTANNVTYAALGEPNGFLGDDAGYWDFYSMRGGPGRLPVWGFATVTESGAPGATVGETFYGYWPLASHALLASDRVGAVGFSASDSGRARLPALYNSYQRVDALSDHRPSDHTLWPLWRPLHITGWLAADQLAEADDHGAEQVLVTAASSKTALAFAQAYRQRPTRARLVALTSPRNRGFVEQSGLYDAVVTYDAIDALPVVPAALVDFANAAPVDMAVRARLGSALRFDLVVGFTHWTAGAAERMPGVDRTPFFAPGRLAKRGREWGGAVLRDRLAAAWAGFMNVAPGLARLDERYGSDAALAAWREVVTGAADPATGILLHPNR